MTVIEPLSTPTDLDDYQSGNVTALLAAADAAVRAYCGWHIAPEITETVAVADGFLGDTLFLPTMWLTSVESIVIDTIDVDLTTVEVFRNGLVRRLNLWDWSWSYWCPSPTATVTMVHGYEATPADLLAVIGSVASRAQQSPNGVVRQQVGLVSTTYSQSSFNVAGGLALLQFEKDILDKYRIPAAT